MQRYCGPIPMSVDDAVKWSDAALEETRRVLSNGNNNPWASVPGSTLRVGQEIMNEEVLAKRVYPNEESLKAQPDPFLRTLKDGKIAAAFKCGNCGENASVAFSLLFAAGVAPVAKCFVPQPYDHAFVLIKVAGDQTVICDPWANLTVRPEHRQQWKVQIWGNDLPGDALFQLEASCDRPGTETEYQFLTQSQNVPAEEKMEMSA